MWIVFSLRYFCFWLSKWSAYSLGQVLFRVSTLLCYVGETMLASSSLALALTWTAPAQKGPKEFASLSEGGA